MTIADCIRVGTGQLAKAMIQCADPKRHMEQIIEAVIGLSPTEIILQGESTLNEKQQEEIQRLIDRRITGEPFQYIVGHEWFWNWSFKVGPGVFIPRKETEILIERVLERTGDGLKVAELGAGSGIIGITLLKERPNWQWHAFEKNPESVPYIKENCQKLLPREAQYHLHEGDFFDGVEMLAPLDAIITNPPYVPRRDLPTLSKEVQHEPSLALDGGDWGLEVLERIVSVGRKVLKEGGFFATEMDPRQKDALMRILAEQGFERIEAHEDYSHRTRVVLATKRG